MKKATPDGLLLTVFALLAGGWLLLSGCGEEEKPDPWAINFDHLEHLTETIEMDGRPVDIVHIYANAPDYEWVGDGDEGIACVDDVARAARVYLREFEATGDTTYAERAKRLLEFVFVMQTESGEFANFIWPDHTINTSGRTSKPSLNFWAARAVHSLALAQRVLADYDPEFAARADSALGLTLANVEIEFVHGRSNLGVDAGPDMIAVYTLGLLERRKVRQSAHEDTLIARFAERIASHVFEGSENFPFTVHMSWRDVWHKWGMLQVEALARAGEALDRPDLIDAARREAEGFQVYLYLHHGPVHFVIENGDTTDVRWYPQIAYGAASHGACQKAMYEVTGEEQFAANAELAYSWLTGLNPARKPVYDPATGRCYDGINGPSSINHNSGAESTIEALLALQDVRELPGPNELKTHPPREG